MCISVGETSIKLRLIQQRHIIFLGCELKKDQKKEKKPLKLAFVHIFKLEALRPVKLETFPEMLKVLFDEFLSVSDWKLFLVHQPPLTNPNSSGLNDQCYEFWFNTWQRLMNTLVSKTCSSCVRSRQKWMKPRVQPRSEAFIRNHWRASQLNLISLYASLHYTCKTFVNPTPWSMA